MLRTLFADRSWEATVSYLLSPPLIMSALAVPVALRDAQAGDRPLLWAALYGGLACLMPTVYVGVRVLRGSVGDLLLGERRDRHGPYLVTMLGMGLGWVALDWLGATVVMRAMILAGLVNVAVMAVVTFFWKLSLHTMTIGFALACLALLISPVLGLIFVPLLPLALSPATACAVTPSGSCSPAPCWARRCRWCSSGCIRSEVGRRRAQAADREVRRGVPPGKARRRGAA